MNRHRTCLSVFLLLAVSAAPVGALELGDEAPPLHIKRWLKGGPVDLKEGRGKNIYVIEFWATWCAPCIRGMPHLTELQKKFKDKGVIVVSVTSEDRTQQLKDAEEFLKRRGSDMGYVVAFDDGQKTGNAYMGGFKRNAIPQCFVIDRKGRIVWEGPPRFGLEEVLAQIVTGEYSVESLAAESRKVRARYAEMESLLNAYVEAASKETEQAKLIEAGEKLFKKARADADIMEGLAWAILTFEEIKWRDTQLALRAAQAAMDASRGRDASILDTYAKALFAAGKVREAINYQKKALELLGKHDRSRPMYEERLRQYQQADKT